MLQADHRIDVSSRHVPTAIVVAAAFESLGISAAPFMPRDRFESILQVANDNGPNWHLKRRFATNMLRGFDISSGW